MLVDRLKMILPWVLLFSLLTIHADNYRVTPHKVWIPARQPSTQRNVLNPNSHVQKPDPSTKILGHNNGIHNMAVDHTLPDHNSGIRDLQKQPHEIPDRKPFDRPYYSAMTLNKKVAYMGKVRKYHRSGQIKSSPKGKSTVQISAQTIVNNSFFKISPQ